MSTVDLLGKLDAAIARIAERSHEGLLAWTPSSRASLGRLLSEAREAINTGITRESEAYYEGLWAGLSSAIRDFMPDDDSSPAVPSLSFEQRAAVVERLEVWREDALK